MTESAILCEGYHDRAFWKGWLPHAGCADRGGNRVVKDPWGVQVKGAGHHAYHSRSNAFIRVVPCNGKSNVLHEARLRLGKRNYRALSRLVINVDADVSPGSPGTGLRRQDVEHLAHTFDSAATVNADGEIEIDGGATKISLLRWEVADPVAPGLPNEQTLERLICASLVAAYPARAKVVQDWLDARPLPPPANPKEHAWSYMAGWFPELGCEAFFSSLWIDPNVVRELEARLRSSGAWQIVAMMAS